MRHSTIWAMRGALARSSLQTTALLGLRASTQALTLILLVRLLGPADYGGFAAAAALAAVLGVLPTLGAGFVMLARAGQGNDSIGDVWRYAWPLTLSLGLLLLVLYLPIGYTLTSDTALSWHLLIWLGAAELIAIPFTMLLSFALQARERVPLSQFVQWLPLALRAFAVVPCFWVEESQRLSTYVELLFFVSVVGAFIAFLVARRYVHLDWQPRLFTRKELLDGASYAGMHLVAANPSELDKIIAVRAIGAHDAGVYSASARALGIAVLPVIGMLLASQPRLFRNASDLDKAGHRNAELIRHIVLLTLGWGVLSGLTLAICSPLLPWLFGSAYQASAELMPWFAIAAPFLSLRLSAGVILVAFGRPLWRVGLELGGIAMLIIGMLLFVPTLGVKGLVGALILSEAAMALTGWWLMQRHCITGRPRAV